MSRSYWFTSDTHFFHENIIKYCGRPFKCAEEMNECLIDNWNSVVKPGDYVYHLGDVWMGGESDKHGWLMSRLKGSKTLIVGNHDNIPYMSKGGWWRKVEMWKPMKEWGVLLTHVPVHESSLHERVKGERVVNIHGHTHTSGSPDGPYKSVCVELTNYTPVNLDELI